MTENDHGNAEVEVPAVAPAPDPSPSNPAVETGDVKNAPVETPEHTGRETDVTSTPDKSTLEVKPGDQLHDVLDRFPKGFFEKLSAKDTDALNSGDPQEVARVLKLHVEASSPAPNSQESQPEPEPTPPSPEPEPTTATAPTRLSLKGLSTRDAQHLMDAIQAVKTGKFNSVEEAMKSLATAADPNAPNNTANPNQDQPPAPPPTVAQLTERVTQLKADQKKAAEDYDTAKLLEIGDQLSDAKIDLRDAVKREDAEKDFAQQWNTAQAASIAQAEAKYAAIWSDPNGAFFQAVDDARIAATQRQDPIMAEPDWPLKLADRVHQRMFGKPYTPTNGTPATPPTNGNKTPLPTPPRSTTPKPRGTLPVPSSPGAPQYSVEEGLSMIRNMGEAEADRVLKAMKSRERGAMLARR